MADGNIIIGDVLPANITSSQQSLYAYLQVSFDHPEEGILVLEMLTQSLVRLMSSEIVPAENAAYLFYEANNSRNGVPGFAVHDRVSGGFIFKIEYSGTGFDEVSGHPSQFNVRQSQRSSSLLFYLEARFPSPLSVIPADGKSALENLIQQIEGQQSGLGLGSDFYSQFNINAQSPDAAFSDEFLGELYNTIEFGEEGGRYLVLVVRTEMQGIRFEYGHLRACSQNEVVITDMQNLTPGRELLPANLRETLLKFNKDDILAIYGKGISPIYKI